MGLSYPQSMFVYLATFYEKKKGKRNIEILQRQWQQNRNKCKKKNTQPKQGPTQGAISDLRHTHVVATSSLWNNLWVGALVL